MSKGSGDFSATLEASGVLGITRELAIGSEKFICFTRFSQATGELLIGVSDGSTIWRVGLSEDEVREHGGDRSEVNFLHDVSHTLREGEVQLLHLQNQLELCLMCPSRQVSFTLCEVSAVEQKAELKKLLFTIWNTLQSVQSDLQALKKDVSSGTTSEVTMPSGGASKSATSKPKRAKGASLVNPTTKRRKAATGVVFGADNS